ncbi:hypothetical protein KBD69_05415 [Candidatus Woesebacteria bacterium]|nr:hypothetical protein [Candidatus Woesebacteria bacterium]
MVAYNLEKDIRVADLKKFEQLPVFMSNFTLLPEDMYSAIEKLAEGKIVQQGRFFTRLLDLIPHNESMLEKLSSVAELMLGMYEPTADITLVHEKVQYEVAEIVNASGWETPDDRDEMVAPYEKALEKMAKARTTLDVILGMRGEGNQEEKPSDQEQIINWAYEQQDKSLKGDYADFERRFIEISGVKSIPETEKMILPWLYMQLSGDNSKYVAEIAENLRSNILLEPSLVYGIAVAGEREGQRLEVTTRMSLGERNEIAKNIDDPAWLTLDINPATSLMQGSKIWQRMIERKTGLPEHAMTMAIPLASDEARAWVNWESRDKAKISRELVVEAWLKRAGMIGMHAGFGGKREVYANPVWSQIVDQVNPDVKRATNWSEVGRDSLEGRVVGVWMEVMGGGETMQAAKLYSNENPAMMLHNAAIPLELLRSLGGIEQGDAATITVDAGHSMSGEITAKGILLAPWSCRENLHFLLLSPVATVDKKGMPFLYSKHFRALNELIKFNSSELHPLRVTGRVFSDLAEKLRIAAMMTRQLVNPVQEEGVEAKYGKILEAIHRKTLADELLRLNWQRLAIHNSTGEHMIDEMWSAVATVAGDRATILYGEDDPILKYKRNKESILLGAGRNLYVRELERQHTLRKSGLSMFIAVPKAFHYLETTPKGRDVLRMAVKELF